MFMPGAKKKENNKVTSQEPFDWTIRDLAFS